MAHIPKMQAQMTRQASRVHRIWQFTRSKIVYDVMTAEGPPAIFFARLTLWITCVVCLMLTLTYSLFDDPISRIFQRIDLLVFTPGLLATMLVAYSKSKFNILYANYIAQTSIFLAFFLSIPYLPDYSPNASYYIFLPLIALSYLSLLVIWAEFPIAIFAFGVAHICAIVSSVILLDPNWKQQSTAFMIYFLITAAVFAFNIISRHFMLCLHQSMLLARRSAAEADTKDRMLNLAVEMNFPALICFDADGVQIANRGERAQKFTPPPDAEDSPLTLRKMVQHFQTTFDIDLSTPNDSTQKICLDDRHYLIIRRDSFGIVAFAFIDITDRIHQDERLYESQKLGLIGEITSGIAHDYNNLLAIMMSNLEAIPKPIHNKIWTPYLSTTYKSIDQAKVISSKLLTIAGKRAFNLETISIGAVIEDLTPLLETAVGDEISLRVDIKDTLYADADSSELGSVILNLAINARNAMDRPDGQIDIRVYEADDKAVVEVEDNGAGISEQNQSRVFDPFYTTKNRQNSTGLGLSLVKSFVEQCGGDIQLESRSGKTLFRLRFPKAAQPVAGATTPDALEDTLPNVTHNRILLVDDNVELARSMQLLLSSKGYECTVVTSAKEAIIAAQKTQNFTAAILDFSMPETNGITLSKTLMPLLPDTTFFLLTGDIDDATQAKALDGGFKAVLLKPIKIQNLIATVNSHCQPTDLVAAPT